MPAACQSREAARPQAGESAFPHNTLKPKCTLMLIVQLKTVSDPGLSIDSA